MKKIIVIILICVLILPTSLISFANNKNVLMLKDYDEEEENEIFESEFLNEIKSMKEELIFNYNYTIKDEKDGAHIKLKGNVKSKNIDAKLYAEDSVEKIITDNNIFYDGSLEGELNYKSNKYDIIIGFMKKNDNESIVLNIYDGNENIVLLIGKSVYNKNDIDNVKKNRKGFIEKQKDDNLEIQTLSSSHTFSRLEYLYSKIKHNDYDHINGMKLGIYYDLADYVLMMQTKTYKNNLWSALSSDPFSSDLEVYEIYNHVHLNQSTVSNTYPAMGQDGYNVNLWNIFTSVLSNFDFNASSILSELLEGTNGYLNVYDDTYNASMKIRSGSSVEINADDEEMRFFISYIENPNGVVAGVYKGYVEYKETYSIPGSGYVFIYYKTNQLYENFSLTR